MENNNEVYEVFYINVDSGCSNCAYFRTLGELAEWLKRNREYPYNHEPVILEIHNVKDYDEWRKNHGEKADELAEKLEKIRG